MPRPSQNTPRDTKTELLDRAEYAARKRGWDGFSYADLAKTVGIRKASIHYYFPAKSDLSVALIERYAAGMQRVCREIDERCDTASERLMAIVAHYRRALHEGEAVCLCVSFSTSRESLPEEVMARIAAYRKAMIGWLAAAFERAMSDGSVANVADPEKEASAALALLEGAHLAARTAMDVSRFDAAVELLTQRCG